MLPFASGALYVVGFSREGKRLWGVIVIIWRDTTQVLQIKRAAEVCRVMLVMLVMLVMVDSRSDCAIRPSRGRRDGV
jgi:hypothetical protein